MAIFTGTTSVYTAAGSTGVGKFNREDLSDLITDISPTATPFISNIGRTKANAVLHEWMRDSLASAAANAAIEGDELTGSVTASSGTRLSNYCQILRKSVIVSGTQEVVRKAGKGSEIAFAVAKLTKEIARDLEYAALQNTQSVTGDATTARQMKGAAGWVTSNATDKGTGTVTATQSDINLAAQQCWTAGGKPDMIICGGFNKRTISSFTTGVTKNLDARDKRLVFAVDVYETDFGVMKVMPDHFVATDDIFLFQSDLWKLAYLRPLRVEDLAKTGDADKKLLVTEVTLECAAEDGNGYVYDTATS
jgi:hypothetical protein